MHDCRKSHNNIIDFSLQEAFYLTNTILLGQRPTKKTFIVVGEDRRQGYRGIGSQVHPSST